MTEFGVVSPSELPGLLAEVANELGGEMFRNEMLDGYGISREFSPRSKNGESYLKFKVLRNRDNPQANATGVNYVFEEGVTTYLKAFPQEIIEAIGDDAEFSEEDSFWSTDVSKVAFAYEEGEGGLIVPTREIDYGVNDAVVLEVPIIGGQKVLSVEMGNSVSCDVTDTQAGIRLAEYQLEAAAAHGETGDIFDSIVDGLEQDTSRVDEYIQRMLGMVALLRQ